MVISDADPALLRLINGCQRGFPLLPRPFAALAAGMEPGWSEARLLAALQDAQAGGLLARVGAVFAPNTVGNSTLAAMAVPAERLEEVAAFVSRQREVNHNYRRDHHYNLWFVAAAASSAGVAAALSRIRLATGIPPLDLPLLREYHIDLGFSFLADAAAAETDAPPTADDPGLAAGQRQRLLAALSPGLPLTRRPYQALGAQCALSEAQTLAQIAHWRQQGVIRRFGMVVRHQELGYRANAMWVWRIDDDAERERVALALAAEPAVTLCYERPPRPPDWPYQLFTMVHARDAQSLDAALEDIRRRHGLERLPQAVLRSTRRYKQTGACYGYA